MEGLAALGRERNVELVVVGIVDDRPQAALVAEIRALLPGVQVLALGEELDRARIDALLVSGASGIVNRLADDIEVLNAIDRLGRGERVLSNDVIECLVRGIEQGEQPVISLEPTPLTGREREILALLSTGATNRDIAGKLFISEATVKTHLASAYAKLGVSSRHQAVARCVELGVVVAGGR